MKKTSISLITILLLALATPSIAEEKDKEKSFLGTMIGIGVVATGTMFSVIQYNRAKELHSEYRRSAFTANTKKLHKNIRYHDMFCILGAVTASIGAVSIVVNF